MPAHRHSDFYRPDAVPAAQPTASKHWRHTFLNNSVKKLTDFNDFRQVKSWKHLTRNVTDLSISPVRRSHFILGNPEKSFSTVLFRHNSDYLCYLRKKTVIHLPTPPENVAILTCEIMWIAKLFLSEWRFVAFFQTLEALKRASCGLSSVALKRTHCDVWQLECRASSVTASVQSGHFLH